MSRKLTQEEAEQKSLQVGIRMVGKYIDCKTKVEFECPYCQKIFRTILSSISQKHTKSCGCYQKQTSAANCKNIQKRIKTSISRRSAKNGNDLATKYPESINLWDYNKNFPIIPNNINHGSESKFWFKCQNHEHSYQLPICSFFRGNRCPYCRGLKILKGFNDLQSQRPELIKDWHPNNKKSPEEYTIGSGAKVLWLCYKCHQTWSTSIVQRAKTGSGCPYCAGQRATIGKNDLKTIHPNLAEEWSDKNGESPEEYTHRSPKKAWWKCKKCKGEWNANINTRSSQGNGCPYCSGHRVLIGFNDLKTKRPDLAKEWSNKNKHGPEFYSVGSGVKVIWKCQKCHYEWKSTINNRASLNRGCPQCNISKGENKVYDILTKYKVKFDQQKRFSDCRFKNPLAFDFYLPGYNVCIEYQGEQHYEFCKGIHKTKKRFNESQTRDQIKRDYCKANNIKLVEIPYWDIDKIEEILVKELNLDNNV